MNKDKQGWNQFRRIRLDRKALARRARRIEGTTRRHAHRFIIRRIQNVRAVRRQITLWLTMIGFIIAGLGLQWMWGQSNYMVSARQGGGSYVEASLGPITTLNPLYISSSAEATVGRLVFSSLYDYDETGSLHQDIAASLQVDSTGKQYTIKLKPNVTWHDGAPLTAKDIVFTINLIKNPLSRSSLRINWLDVSVQAIDATTVQFSLPTVYAAFPYALSFPVLPEHILSSVSPGAVRENIFSQSPVGSGPFRFKSLQSADVLTGTRRVTLEANKNYYRGQPKLDRFEVQAYTSEEAILSALKSGEVNGAADISITSRSQIPNNYTVAPQPLDSGVYLLLNTTHPALRDGKVRKALQYATDTDAIRARLGGGTLSLDSPFIDGQLTGADIPHTPKTDLTKAKALLDEAGWKAEGSYRVKDGKPLELTITTTKSSEYGAVLEEIVKQWQALGIKVNTRTVDTATVSSTFVQDTLQGRNFDVLLYQLSIGADPDVYAYWHSSQAGPSGYNFTSYSNKTADASLASARSRLESDLRNVKYKQFARQWIEDAPAIGLYQPVAEYVSNKNAQTVRSNAKLVTSTDRLATVIYWTIESDMVYKTP